MRIVLTGICGNTIAGLNISETNFKNRLVKAEKYNNVNYWYKTRIEI